MLASETLQFGWWVYGQTLYYSDQAQECSDKKSSLIDFMSIFLLMQTCKVFIFGFAICILVGILVFKKRQQINQRQQSRGIVQQLSAIKYHSLLQDASSPDMECSICFMEYQSDDLVTRLKCDSKHIFHKECLSQWIVQGKNSCPICRAPVDPSVRR